METKFTPGPWRAEQGAGFHVDQIVITAPSMNARSPLARVSNITGDAWPDAHLIAAATDLYEAAELAYMTLAPLVQVANVRHPTCEKLLAALAKARGEQ